MIPIIRSHAELMAITEGRDCQREISSNTERHISTFDSGQRKRYIRSLNKGVDLPELPKTKRARWICNKDLLYSFFYKLDYNNQIQSSYSLTLLARQDKNNQQDAA